MILFTVTAATALVLFNLIAVGVIASDIAGFLAVDPTRQLWIGKIFLLVVALTVPFSTRIARRFGYKRAFLSGILLMLAGSVGCLISSHYYPMVISRAIAGVGGGLIMTLSVAFLVRSEKSYQLDIYSTLSFGFGIALGVLIGGACGQSGQWRLFFAIEGCLLILTAILTAIFFPETQRQKNRPFDFLGYTCLATFFFVLLLLVTQAKAPWNTYGFSSRLILFYAAVCVVSLLTYIIHTGRTRYPLFHPNLFREPNFTIGLLGLIVVGVMVFGVILISITLLQEVFLYEKMRLGYLMSAIGFTYAVVGFLPRLNPKLFVLPGLALVALSCLLSQFITIQSGQLQIITIFSIRAAGVALAVGPLTSLALSHIPADEAHGGATLILFARSMAGAFGSAIVQLIAEIRAPFHLLRFGEMVDTQSAAYRDHFEALIQMGNTPQKAKLQIIEWVQRQAELAGVIDAIYILGWAVVGVMVMIIALKGYQRLAMHRLFGQEAAPRDL